MKTLDAVDGSRHRAAEILGISRRTLQYRLQEWGIEPRKFTSKAEVLPSSATNPTPSVRSPSQSSRSSD